jgi:hypothetical protein
MAGYYDFFVERGTTFKRTLGWRVGGLPVDVTGFTARLELRRTLAQPTPDYTLTSDPGGGIVMGKADGRIDVTTTPEWSSAMKSAIYFYWLDINTGSEVTRLIEGRVTVKEGALL